MARPRAAEKQEQKMLVPTPPAGNPGPTPDHPAWAVWTAIKGLVATIAAKVIVDIVLRKE
jgi:hypothetical protein